MSELLLQRSSPHWTQPSRLTETLRASMVPWTWSGSSSHPQKGRMESLLPGIRIGLFNMVWFLEIPLVTWLSNKKPQSPMITWLIIQPTGLCIHEQSHSHSDSLRSVCVSQRREFRNQLALVGPPFSLGRAAMLSTQKSEMQNGWLTRVTIPHRCPTYTLLSLGLNLSPVFC